MNPRVQAILNFWFEETPPEKRFKKDESFDLLIRNKFLSDYEKASNDDLNDWKLNAKSSLAIVILFDQFSRNIFRNDKKAFSQDFKTREIVYNAIDSGFLDEMSQSEKFFMILPLIHSEEIKDHEIAYSLLDKHLRDHPGLKDIKKFWEDHTVAIKKFKRYPHRNEILERESTKEEIEFLKNPNSSW